MQKIELRLPEAASFMEKVPEFFPEGYGDINKRVEEALSTEKTPENEVIGIKSTMGTLSDAIDEYYACREGSDEEKASIRQAIRWIEDEEELRGVYRDIIIMVDPKSFEFTLFLRKAAEIL